jgi:hypothetical protein
MSSRIGDIELQWFDAGIKQMLMTQWMFEPESGCMFTSDCFGFRHLTRADAIPIVDSKRGIPKIPRIAEELAARMNWLRGAEFPEVVARFETLFRERDVRMIAPVHGCVIRGRDAVRAHVAAMLSALRVTSQLPSLEETRYDGRISCAASRDVCCPTSPGSAGARTQPVGQGLQHCVVRLLTSLASRT